MSTKRGFAALSPERRRQFASAGGKAVHAAGTGHTWTSEEARAAGRRGAETKRRRRADTTTPTDPKLSSR